jgi:hypothetical protein
MISMHAAQHLHSHKHQHQHHSTQPTTLCHSQPHCPSTSPRFPTNQQLRCQADTGALHAGQYGTPDTPDTRTNNSVTPHSHMLPPPLLQVKGSLLTWLQRECSQEQGGLQPFLRNKLAQAIVAIVQVRAAGAACRSLCTHRYSLHPACDGGRPMAPSAVL